MILTSNTPTIFENTILNSIIVFIVFFAICFIADLYKHIDRMQDKKKLLKIKEELPDAKIETHGKVLNVKLLTEISIYIKNERRTIYIDGHDIMNKEYITLYSNDDFEENIKCISDSQSDRNSSFHIQNKKRIWKLAVILNEDEVIIDSDKEYKKNEKITLIKTIGEDNYKIKNDDDIVISTQDKKIDSEVRYLIKHEKMILSSIDKFKPNILFNVFISAGLTLFVYLCISIFI